MPTRTRSARARGLRTLQHQKLPQRTCHGIDTQIWFLSLVAGHETAHGREAHVPTKDEVHDEAIRQFLEQHAEHGPELYPARRTSDQDVTFWVDSRLIERVRQMAVRDGVKPARLIDAALSGYVSRHVSEELLQFRLATQQQAATLLKAARQGGRPRRARPRS